MTSVIICTFYFWIRSKPYRICFELCYLASEQLSTIYLLKSPLRSDSSRPFFLLWMFLFWTTLGFWKVLNSRGIIKSKLLVIKNIVLTFNESILYFHLNTKLKDKFWYILWYSNSLSFSFIFGFQGLNYLMWKSFFSNHIDCLICRFV